MVLRSPNLTLTLEALGSSGAVLPTEAKVGSPAGPWQRANRLCQRYVLRQAGQPEYWLKGRPGHMNVSLASISHCGTAAVKLVI